MTTQMGKMVACLCRLGLSSQTLNHPPTQTRQADSNRFQVFITAGCRNAHSTLNLVTAIFLYSLVPNSFGRNPRS